VLGVGDESVVAEVSGDPPGRAEEHRVGVRGPIGTGARDLEGSSVIQVPGDRSSDSGDAAQRIANANANAKREFHALWWSVVAVMLSDEIACLPERDGHDREQISRTAVAGRRRLRV